ncbi:MFS general substrate transporter [Pleurostoma richardsiae]|uniref:MFS general substrate transporter n=1 Tax=Pleurostoma richardsiae TaxID=41990 RepID=A0AA38RNG8_9PEZI|nr:MFS general substrate transporter [Pleurostoma richardsiae]
MAAPIRVSGPGDNVDFPMSSGTDSDTVFGIGLKDLEKRDTQRITPPSWESDIPDGGLAAWLCVLGAWCTSICSFGWLNSVGTFQQYYESEPLREYSSSTISWIPSLQIFFMMAMGPIVGKSFDRHGPRALLLVGSFLHVFGLMMASISTEYYQFMLSQGVCSAIGVAAIFQPAINCINGWFNRKRGIAFGIVATGSSIGGVIFPIVVSRLINSVGYGWAMRISAFLILALLAIANFTVRSRLPPRPTNISSKQMSQPFHERGFLFLLFGMFFLTFGIYVPITYLAVDAYEHGMSPSLAQYLVAILNAASLFGRLLAGFTSDKVGKYNTFAISCYLTGVSVLALWIPGTSNGATVAFAILFGFFSGAYVSLIAALVAHISPLPEIGFRTGLVFLFASLPGLTTDPIAGAIIDHTGSWVGLKVFAGGLCLVGTTFIVATRVSHVGWNLTAVF